MNVELCVRLRADKIGKMGRKKTKSKNTVKCSVLKGIRKRDKLKLKCRKKKVKMQHFDGFFGAFEEGQNRE
jgi:hypothetical protein